MTDKVELKRGDIIEFTDTILNMALTDVTIGQHYIIEGKDKDGDAYFCDDVQDDDFAASDKDGLGGDYKIVGFNPNY